MVLIKSISGIRGTLENIPGESLSDYDLKQFTLAYIFEVIKKENSNKIVVGRDARRSGIRISNIVIKGNEKIKIGDKVKVFFDKVSDELTIPKFKKVESN